MQDLNLCLLQANLQWENPEANRAHFESMMEEAAPETDMFMLPETFTTGFPVDPDRFAEKEDGISLRWMHEMAQHHQAVVCGSLLMKHAKSFYNTFVWMTPSGEKLTYRKRHVFRMGGEHNLIQPGHENILLTLKGWKIRPQICYDLRFPVWSRNRFETSGFDYDLLLYVANWPAVRSFAWKQLLVARAIENQCFVAGLNRVGSDPDGLAYTGDSVVLDARGESLVAGSTGKEERLQIQLKSNDLLQFRDQFKVGLDWDDYFVTS